MADQLELRPPPPSATSVAVDELVLRREDLVASTCQGSFGIERDDGRPVALDPRELRWLVLVAGPAALDHLHKHFAGP